MMRSLVSLFMIAVLPFSASAADMAVTLQDAYASAFRTYESIPIAEQEIRRSEAVIDQAWTYLYPRLRGSASYTWYNEVLPPPSAAGGSSFTFQPKEEVTAGLTLTQPLYTGGRTLAALRTARKMQDASRQGLAAARQDLMLNVAQAFYGTLKAQKLVEAGRESLDRMERNLRVTEREASVRRSRANTSALLRANTLVSGARIMLIASEDGLRMARRDLSLLTGLPEGSALVEPDQLPAPDDEYGSLLAKAYENRQDYLRAKLDRDMAAENVTIVRGGHYPQLYAEGGLRYKSTDPETMDEGSGYYGGVRLEVPLFEGGLLSAEVSEAKARLRQAELAVDLLKRSIEREVHQAWTGLRTATTIIGMLRQQFDDARRNFVAVEDLYREGLVSSLQVIDAQQALLLTEREYVNVRYDQQVAVLRLQRAIGLLGPDEQPVKEGAHATS